MNAETIRVAELFAGIGGFRLGLENANLGYSGFENREKVLFNPDAKPMPSAVNEDGNRRAECSCNFKVVWANEWDKYACQIYRKNFGTQELFEGDIRKVNANDIPDIDLIVGGFPCQPHSLAGKRQGFSDERGTVFHEIIRVAKAKRPQMLLLENVKGLLSSEQGRAFGTVLEELGNIGYWCEWKTLNSKFFGVPQNRERVFIIGHLRGTGGKQVFPVGEIGEEADELQGYVSCTVTGRYASSQSNGDFVIEGQRKAQAMRFVRTEKAKEIRRQNQLNGKDDTPFGEGFRELVPSDEDISGCVTGALNRDSLIAQALQTDGFLRQGSSFGTSNPQSSRNIRRLTPTECERLQGFPDGFTNSVSDTQRYKTLGNAVTVNVIQAIGELILEAWN